MDLVYLLPEGVLQMVRPSAAIRFAVGKCAMPRSSMPALSGYSSPLASYAEHTPALLNAGAFWHPTYTLQR